MKKSHLIISLLAVTLVGGHYVLWQKAANHMRHFVEVQIEASQEELRIPLNGTLDIDYKITGYPLAVKANITRFDITIQPPKQEQTVRVNLEGEFNIQASILNYGSYSFDAAPLRFVFTTTRKGLANGASTTLHVKKFSGNGTMLEEASIPPITNINMQDASFLVNGKKMINIASIKQQFTQDTAGKLSTAALSLDVEGITLFNPPQNKGGKDVYLDSFKTATHVKNVSLDALKVLQAGLQTSTQLDGSTDGIALRRILTNYVESVVENESEIVLDEVTIKKNDFTVTVKGNLKIDALKRLNGAASLHIEGLNSLQKAGTPFTEIASNPMLQGLLAGKESIDLFLEASDGLAKFNGAPFMALPNVVEIIFQIPDEIAVEALQQESELDRMLNPQR